VILDRFLLTDQTAIITGAGRGIGAAIAVAYAQAGADVVIASRTQEQLDKVAAQVAEAGRRAVVVPCDLNDTSSLPTLVERAMTEFGRIDIVVNNVGGSAPRPFLDTSEGYLERAFHFNVTTAFALSKAAAPHLLEGEGGSIVNISSAMGRLRDRGFVAYGVAKAALAHLTRLLAIDLAPRVRVNGIAVGSVATSALETVLSSDALLSEMVGKTPLKRLGQPEEIAAAALYLASPAGAYITGKLIEVDGGLEAPNLNLNLPDL
jgi:7-alpha-hydroxysteroid dehydrogenase